jgi:hypothetical protein
MYGLGFHPLEDDPHEDDIWRPLPYTPPAVDYYYRGYIPVTRYTPTTTTTTATQHSPLLDMRKNLSYTGVWQALVY